MGSSPHTRGAPPRNRFTVHREGIIPAYAGSTTACPSPSGGGRDHPRIRGEHSRMSDVADVVRGSSPHTRGARRHVRPARRHHRIIPAYAGSTSTRSLRTARRWDHPRIRGEHIQIRVVVNGFDGSSPHTRGAHPPRPERDHPGGIIPAYAGSTRNQQNQTRWTPDHPRIRGEHQSLFLAELRDGGSSPHTRGAPEARKSHLLCLPDHPRIRGEHVDGVLCEGDAVGSSPHTRGALPGTLGVDQRRRIIPAYAGSTRQL